MKATGPLLLTAAIFIFSAPVLGDECLDRNDLQLTFSEEFDELDVSPWGPGTRWIAHTPWAGDFGDAKFVNPDKRFPFQVEDGILRIEARKGEDGKWRSGLLASVDKKGSGFSQKFGYFEIRAKLPIGPGVWPAFWLIGLDRSHYTAEVNVFEHYGHMADRYSSNVHVWRKNGNHYTATNRNFVFNDSVRPDDFNTFGVATDPEWTTFYFNDCEVWRTKTPSEHQQPMMILLNLALGSGFPIEETPNPSYMFVDYVRAYALPQNSP